MSESIDTSELEKLSASFTVAAARLPAQVRTVVTVGARNIKDETRANVSDHPRWKRIAYSVDYDMTGNAHYSAAEIGYNDVGQGEFAGIVEFGSARKAPHPALMPAFRAEVPRFEKAMGDLVSKVGDSL